MQKLVLRFKIRFALLKKSIFQNKKWKTSQSIDLAD